MTPDVSVVIPTKGRADDLMQCVASLLRSAALTESSVQVLVVDDGRDSDGARLVVERLVATAPARAEIAYARNDGRPGAASARNIGASLAESDVLGFVDDDAVVNGSWVAIAKANVRPGRALTGRIESNGATDPFTQARQARYDKRRSASLRRPCVDYLAGGNSVVWRGDFESVGGFDERFAMMHDRDLALRLVRSGVEIRYQDDLAIAHRHFKTFGLYAAMTVRSGTFRRKLHLSHPQAVAPWSLRDAIAPLRDKSGSFQLNLVTSVSESLHGLGYTAERYRERIGGNRK